MDEFVKQVVEGEGGSGTVHIDATGGPDTGFKWHLAVWTGDYQAEGPAYVCKTPMESDDGIDELEKRLAAAGLNVIRDAHEWRQQCAKWAG